tara:strand:+ start:1320 stop:1991 length:672 start_codon:yes stop_codon:yes gene_type:complete
MTFIAVAIVGAASIAGSAISAGAANKQGRRAAGRARDAQNRMEAREAQLQDVINPYDQMTDLSSLIKNPMANLQVATEAAAFQAEQADISLANSLDQSRSFGFGGGGATALAQAALQSKRGISANIQQQEARNEMLRAQGEQGAMMARLGEGRRMQSMVAEGRAYEFNVQEGRDQAYLDRQAGISTGERGNANKLFGQSASIIGQAIPNAVTAGLGTYNAMNS